MTSTSDHHGYAYDASGNATCRTASTTTPCSGTPTGAALSYDDEGRLSHWQTSPTSSATTDDLVYDGAGQRVEQQVTTGGSTTTLYIGQLTVYSLTGTACASWEGNLPPRITPRGSALPPGNVPPP